MQNGRMTKSFSHQSDMMKGIMGADRQRNWSELGKEGRLLILFVSQVIGCYMAYIRKTKLDKDFHSLQSILDEMRPIRYNEHPNTQLTFTPFVGDQVSIFARIQS